MNDENWKEQFKEWKTNLKPFQIKLLEEGAQSNSQTLMLCDMWCEWKDLAAKRKLNEIANKKLCDLGIDNSLDENESEEATPCGYVRVDIDDQLLLKVKPLARSVKGDLDKGALAKERLSLRRDSEC